MKAATIEATYENVYAVCPSCSHRNVFNRASDLRRLDSICNAGVACQNSACGEAFHIYGDLVNPGYEVLLLEAWEFLHAKKFMPAVVLATTACEMFFNHYLLVELVLRPSRRDHGRLDEILLLNQNVDVLQQRLERHTFGTMRDIFLRHAIADTRPATMQMSSAAIAAIPDRPTRVTDAEVAAVAQPARRELLTKFHSLSIHQLRNSIVHKTAYRPRADEATVAIEAAYRAVFAASGHFGLADQNYHLNEPLEEVDAPR